MVLKEFLAGMGGGATVSIFIKAIDQYSNEFKKTKNEMNALKASASGLAIGGFVVAATALASFAYASVKASARMEPIRKSFQGLTEDSDNFLKTLQKATNGTVSSFDLMSSANKALVLGLKQNDLPKLFESAMVLGKATGRTATEAINDITLGIGRQSRMILDNLGIMVNAEDAAKKWADANGRVVGSLTSEERQLAFTTAAMEQMTVKAAALKIAQGEDLLDSTQRLKASYEDLSVEIGQALTPAVQELFDTLLLHSSAQREVINDLKESNKEYHLVKASVDFWAGAIKEADDKLQLLKKSLADVDTEIRKMSKTPFVGELENRIEILKKDKEIADVRKNMDADALGIAKSKGVSLEQAYAEVQANIDSLENQKRVLEEKNDTIGMDKELLRLEVDRLSQNQELVNQLKDAGVNVEITKDGFISLKTPIDEAKRVANDLGLEIQEANDGTILLGTNYSLAKGKLSELVMKQFELKTSISDTQKDINELLLPAFNSVNEVLKDIEARMERIAEMSTSGFFSALMKRREEGLETLTGFIPGMSKEPLTPAPIARPAGSTVPNMSVVLSNNVIQGVDEKSLAQVIIEKFNSLISFG